MDFIRGPALEPGGSQPRLRGSQAAAVDLERATFANINAAERIFWRNTIVPEVRFLEEHLNRMLLPRLGYPDLELEFDLTAIEAMQEDENSRVSRQMQLLDRGVLTINEVRRQPQPAGRSLGQRASNSVDTVTFHTVNLQFGLKGAVDLG